MKNNNKVLICTILLVAIIGFTYFSKPQNQTLKAIGDISPLSGPAATIGEEVKRSIYAGPSFSTRILNGNLKLSLSDIPPSSIAEISINIVRADPGWVDIKVYVGSNLMGKGTGHSKQVAQQQAARMALDAYKNRAKTD